MLVMIAWYNCVICETLECEHVYSSNMVDEELCDYRVQGLICDY